MATLSQKVAIVTGASKGIGEAAALALAAKGASVVINYSSDDRAANKVLQAIGAERALLVKADVSTVAGIEQLIKATVQRFGKIDILVPNAGVLPMKDLEHTSEDDFDKTFALNVKGPYFLIQKAVSYIPKGGHIVFLSTTLTKASTVQPGYLLYNSTKGAIEQMTRVLCKDLGHKGIFVNSVAPGPTGTELFYKGKSPEMLKMIAGFNPQNRIGKPEEVAEAIAYLAESAWVSGQVLAVNGGMA
ncbi:MAG: putative secondary metabolism biosynthetic enzyme [Bathelium mastoideum]|nr:MAG: putative secondary metabolism biosynthetic enzyme [Bathelium mastoideum]